MNLMTKYSLLGTACLLKNTGMLNNLLSRYYHIHLDFAKEEDNHATREENRMKDFVQKRKDIAKIF